jgi:hypothetical protein
MLRFLGVILLSVCVVAMPTYAAVTCASLGCGPKADKHPCCPTKTTVSQAVDTHQDGRHDSPHSGDGRAHCTAPCCGFVAHVVTLTAPSGGEALLTELPATDSGLHDFVDHDAIFHPPRT